MGGDARTDHRRASPLEGRIVSCRVESSSRTLGTTASGPVHSPRRTQSRGAGAVARRAPLDTKKWSGSARGRWAWIHLGAHEVRRRRAGVARRADGRRACPGISPIDLPDGQAHGIWRAFGCVNARLLCARGTLGQVRPCLRGRVSGVFRLRFPSGRVAVRSRRAHLVRRRSPALAKPGPGRVSTPETAPGSRVQSSLSRGLVGHRVQASSPSLGPAQGARDGGSCARTRQLSKATASAPSSAVRTSPLGDPAGWQTGHPGSPSARPSPGRPDRGPSDTLRPRRPP
jgi:hypothetical protein